MTNICKCCGADNSTDEIAKRIATRTPYSFQAVRNVLIGCDLSYKETMAVIELAMCTGSDLYECLSRFHQVKHYVPRLNPWYVKLWRWIKRKLGFSNGL